MASSTFIGATHENHKMIEGFYMEVSKSYKYRKTCTDFVVIAFMCSVMANTIHRNRLSNQMH